MTTLVVDIYEADKIDTLLHKYHVSTVRQNLVSLGLADFFWLGNGGIKYTLEHKTARQLCSEMGQRLDGQLRKHSQNADVVGLVVDGIMTPREGGGVNFWKLAETNEIYYKYGETPIGFEVVQAYLWSLNRDGIYTFNFDSLDAMALGLASFVSNSLKVKHNTLTHHVRSKPVTWSENPYVMTLMGLYKARIGEKTALTILKHFGTPYKFFYSDYDEGVSVVGKDVFTRAMKAIGRTTL